MSAENENSNNWYQPPANEPPPQWPRDLLVGNEELGPFRGKLALTDGGAPTLYRADTLVATAAAVDDAVLAQLAAGLASLNWSITRGAPGRGGEVTLNIRSADSSSDAWPALQHLRAVRDEPGTSPAAAAAIDGLALQRFHFIGMPAKEGHAGTGRAAITLVAPPARSAADRVPGGRRPVVALVDSGVGRHPWLDGAGEDAFWADARDLGWTGVPAGPAADQGGGDVSPADGKLDTHAGHGTFIAGLIRQLAPDARVLSLPAMQGDGVLDESVVLDALDWLLARVRGAAHDAAKFVDVVNLSFGYYEKLPADHRHTLELRAILGELGSLGVQVVASAGNDAGAQPVFPAAFADPAYSDKPAVPLIGVGALNPDGSHADYSNFGLCGEVWAPGTAVPSTIPPRFGMSPGPVKETYDSDNLSGGFVQWSGTSFAAAVVSGRYARALYDGASDDELTDVSPEAACRRAGRARAAATGG